MKNTQKIIDQNNRELMQKVIPDKSLPIFGNPLTNCNDPIFNKSFEEIRKEAIIEILEHQTFLTEFESIKHNLNLE